jgi:hypothetical protein
MLSFRARRRASLEFELVALRHQVTVRATPWSASALLHRPTPLGVALPGLATGPQRHGTAASVKDSMMAAVRG